MRGLNAYTLCSGIICEELNGSDYMAIPLKGNREDAHRLCEAERAKVSHIGNIYRRIEEISGKCDVIGYRETYNQLKVSDINTF